ncbi:Hypothetical protein A7982_05265 [Minicystis rosea]|nr:Hypothetical protein A7982_05265 [Minicystis rosea]
MAKYIHVVLRLPVQMGKFLFHAKAVLVAVKDNPRFPDAGPLVVPLGEGIVRLEEALHGTTAERSAAREAVRDALVHLGDHVQSVAEKAAGTVDLSAVRALVESAGMDLRKISTHPKATFAAKYGPVAGSVDLTAPHSPARDSHEWEMSIDQRTWMTLPSTRQAKTRVEGLPMGTAHHFRHRFLTKDGHTAWSDPTVTIIVK